MTDISATDRAQACINEWKVETSDLKLHVFLAKAIREAENTKWNEAIEAAVFLLNKEEEWAQGRIDSGHGDYYEKGVVGTCETVVEDLRALKHKEE